MSFNGPGSQLGLSTIYRSRVLQRRFIDLCAVALLCLLLRGLFRSGLFSTTHTVRRRRGTDDLVACQSPGRPNDERPISAHHVHAPGGLLHVKPNGIHPILALTKQAENEWDRKLDRSSRTLEEAVKEYKRRYRRDPPAGFDDWWDFAQEMDSQLPDEYDSIHRALEPFWGMDPVELVKIQAEHETRMDTYTILKNETHDTHLYSTSFSDPENWEKNNLLRGLEGILKLLDPVEPALRSFRATFSPHFEPSLLSDYHIKNSFIDAASAGKYVNTSNLPEAQNFGFASACAPGSPGRSLDQPINSSFHSHPRTRRTFIYNHRSSMDPCENPYLFDHHTLHVTKFDSVTAHPKLAPQFSFSSTPLYLDIPLPSFFGWAGDDTIEDPLEWESKKDERLRWRGNNVGMLHRDTTRWRDSHRSRLVEWANDLNGTIDSLLPGPVEDEGWERVGFGTKIKKSAVKPALLDVAFAGKAVGCDVQYCRFLETQFDWMNDMEIHEKDARNYKYALDVDGKGPSTDFKKLMSSNSLVFKATVYPEWWLERSQPWLHYIPIQIDYSDVLDTLLFFRGGLYGENNHDYLAKRIAYAGKEWSKTFWREEDMTVYLFRLLLEYTRVMSLDRESMSYKPGALD